LISCQRLLARVLFCKKGFKRADQLFKVNLVQALLGATEFQMYPHVAPLGIAKLVYQTLMHGDAPIYDGWRVSFTLFVRRIKVQMKKWTGQNTVAWSLDSHTALHLFCRPELFTILVDNLAHNYADAKLTTNGIYSFLLARNFRAGDEK
jgi:hypothetical protein